MNNEYDDFFATKSLIDLTKFDQSHYDRGRPGWIVFIWWFLQAIIFPLTPHTFHTPRIALLKLFGAKIGKGVFIRPTARFTYPWKITIGDYTWIGDDVVLYSYDQIIIGEHCIISQKTYICSGSHDPHDRTFKLTTKPVLIGNGVWIATDSFIAPGVKIGANAVVGARSNVFSDIPAQKVCWGSPCRPHYDRVMND